MLIAELFPHPEYPMSENPALVESLDEPDKILSVSNSSLNAV